ncbi:MAG TPA: hypothetical protein VL325_07780 [Pyrinomonadaceae bacterium]|jgi:hypothetical protein|nr:hypothetical protein [Pyrinomonadaceae bacterium]
MSRKLAVLWTSFVFSLSVLSILSPAQSPGTQTLSGTLVVAVPVSEGLVGCADKRLYNEQTGKADDDFVKIRKVNNNAFFVATHTVGFLDRSTGKLEFDVFDITDKYVAQHPFVAGPQYWNGLRNELRKQLLVYLQKRKFKDWPETDSANNRLLFNLVFFATSGNTTRSYTLRVFYEKQQTPDIDVPNVISEVVRTPKLIGKGKEVIDYLARNPGVAADPSILRFDQGRFDIAKTSATDAVEFAKKLFSLTNANIPQARVSATFDCALLGYQNGFQWIGRSETPRAAVLPVSKRFILF